MKKHLIKYLIHSAVRIVMCMTIFIATFCAYTPVSSKNDYDLKIIIYPTAKENNQEEEPGITPLHDLEEFDIDPLE